MSFPCGQPVHFCHFRAARLNANGTRAVGSDNRYETAAGISMQVDPVNKEGESFEQQGGCGNVCTTVETDCDRTKAYTLTLQICAGTDFELKELLLGGTLAASGGQSIGYVDPDPLTACGNGVMVEAWSLAWDGDQQMVDGSGQLLYHRLQFPKVTWIRGGQTRAKGPIVETLIGKAVPNINAGLGIDGSHLWPQLVPGPMGEDLITSIPSANCGALPTLSVAS